MWFEAWVKKLIRKFTVTHLQDTGLIREDAVRLHTPLVCASFPFQQEEGTALLTTWSWGLHHLGSACVILCLWGACPGSVQRQLKALELRCIQMLTLWPGNHGGIFRAQVCYLFRRQRLGGIQARKIGSGCQSYKAGKEADVSTVLHLDWGQLAFNIVMLWKSSTELKKNPPHSFTSLTTHLSSTLLFAAGICFLCHHCTGHFFNVLLEFNFPAISFQICSKTGDIVHPLVF